MILVAYQSEGIDVTATELSACLPISMRLERCVVPLVCIDPDYCLVYMMTC